MKPPVITVFGGTGFVGRAIVEQCAQQGWTVRVATRLAAQLGGCRQFSGVGQVVPFEVDYKDDASIRRALDGADFAVNTIGILHESGKKTFQRVHVELAERIATAAAQEGVAKLVHISALGCDKNKSKYAQSKLNGENAVQKAFPNATMLRASLIFGPADDFFNKFAGYMRFLPVLPLIGGGHTKFQPVYVEDVASAAVAALRDNAQGQTFEIAGPDVYSFKDMMLLLRTLTQRHPSLVSVPFWYAKMKAAFLGLMPNPMLTIDNVESLKTDSVAGGVLPDLSALGIQPASLMDVLPSYVSRFIPGGPQYA